MGKNAIFAECSQSFWIDVAQKMADDNDWSPVYWIGVRTLREQVEKRFPNVVYHNTLDAVRGIVPAPCADLKVAAIGQPLLERLAHAESIALKMMDRMDPAVFFAYRERVRHYHRLLMYWGAILDRFSVDIVFFKEAPHMIYDFVLYALCGERGVETVMFEQTALPSLVFPLRHFEQGSVEIEADYEERLSSGRPYNVKLSADAERHVTKMIGSYSGAIPTYMKRQLDQPGRIATIEGAGVEVAPVLARARYQWSRIKWTARRLTVPAPPNYLKQKRQTIEASQVSGAEWLGYRYLGIVKKKKLKRLYDRLAQEVDLTKPFIYVPLNYQPEKTTLPMGGRFADLYLLVSLLSKCVPDGWHVYVKEHINQFQPYYKGQLSRSADFYRDLIALPNISLVPLSASSFRLIDGAKAVATATGTAGWEAVLRGKPALVFGYAWYRACEGVFCTPSAEACHGALDQIEKGFQVDLEKVRLFIEIVEKVCVKGYCDSRWQDDAGVTEAENVAALSGALQRLAPTNSA